jgi:hypothetical protein
VAQTNTGIFFSTDNGLHWRRANTNLADSLAATIPADTVNYLISTFLYQLPPLPEGMNLQDANLDLSTLLAIVTSFAILYPQTNLDSLVVSIDSGRTALKISQILSDLALYAAGIDTATVLSQIELAQMMISMNAGKVWMSVQDIMSSVTVRAVAVSSDYAFAGTNIGVFRAALDGTNWTQVNNGLTSRNIHALVIVNGVLFAATDAGVYRTANSGASWSAVNIGLTNLNVLALAATGNAVFAGTKGTGVFVSTNYGGSWKAVNDGLIFRTVNALAIGNDILFAGTTGGGLWKRPVSEMITGVNDNGAVTPRQFSLYQNYPNPFNPSTTIHFELPGRSRVRLTVFNVLGQPVAELANEEMSAGYFERTWIANVASGVYFYRIDATSTDDPNKRFVDVKKMMLLK